MEETLHVLHLIPAAFNYFDDIKGYAFGLIEEMNKYAGIEVSAFTLQYGNVTREEKNFVAEVAPSEKFIGLESVDNAINDFVGFDIIHFHTPFMGGAGEVLRWKKDLPNIPFIITYYRPVIINDLLAWIIKWYNNYYLPKIIAVADLVTFFPWSEKAVERIIKKSGAKTPAVGLLTDYTDGDYKRILEYNLKQKEVVEQLFNLYSNFV